MAKGVRMASEFLSQLAGGVEFWRNTTRRQLTFSDTCESFVETMRCRYSDRQIEYVDVVSTVYLETICFLGARMRTVFIGLLCRYHLGASATTLAEITHLPKKEVYTFLGMLMRCGFVEKISERDDLYFIPERHQDFLRVFAYLWEADRLRQWRLAHPEVADSTLIDQFIAHREREMLDCEP